MLRDVHALWIGPDLPPRAAGCLNSFARAGHRVVLHSYARLAGVPDTITTDDADAIVPR